MIFKQVNEIRNGTKTMTQRVGDTRYVAEEYQDEITRVYLNGRLKWQVGRTYTATPKRGQRGFGKYTITRIRWRFLHEMTEEDAVKEGVANLEEYRALWDSINGRYKGKRWEDNPTVFSIEFKYVGDVA